MFISGFNGYGFWVVFGGQRYGLYFFLYIWVVYRECFYELFFGNSYCDVLIWFCVVFLNNGCLWGVL